MTDILDELQWRGVVSADVVHEDGVFAAWLIGAVAHVDDAGDGARFV